MLAKSVSRREFFARLVGLGVPATIPAVPPVIAVPEQAWVIVELGWESMDDYVYPHGEFTRDRFFSDRSEAEAECRRLCNAFFAAQTPAEFAVDCEGYFSEPRDNHTVTWTELCKAGFPYPFYVCQLQATPVPRA
jgi:hypothetical protein